MAEYVKFSVGKELKEKQFELIEKVTKTGKIRIGVNETTKAIERGKAKIIFIAEDVSPQELVMHLPLLCEEKKIPYSFISTKKELGEKAGIAVGTASIALIEEGSAKKELEEVIKKVSELKKVWINGRKRRNTSRSSWSNPKNRSSWRNNPSTLQNFRRTRTRQSKKKKC